MKKIFILFVFSSLHAGTELEKLPSYNQAAPTLSQQPTCDASEKFEEYLEQERKGACVTSGISLLTGGAMSYFGCGSPAVAFILAALCAGCSTQADAYLDKFRELRNGKDN